MSWTRTLFVAEGRIQPAGFDELVVGVHTQHRQRLLLSEAFQLAHRAGAEPAVSSCRRNEETLHISEPQAQVRATQVYVSTHPADHPVQPREPLGPGPGDADPNLPAYSIRVLLVAGQHRLHRWPARI